MPEDILDLDEPYPNVVIDRLRRAVKEQLDSLSAEVDRIDDAYLLLLSTVDFARSTLGTVLAGQAAIGDLMSRVKALETAIAPLHDPDSDPVPDGDGAPEDLTDPEETP